MIRFAENLNKMIAAGLGGAMEAPRTEVAVGHCIRYLEASGAVASFETNIAAPIRSLRVDMLPIQEGSGDPSPDNVRPISGRQSATVWREASYDPSADPALTIHLGQTVYGGTVDVMSGKLTVDRAMVDLGTLNWTRQTATGMVDRYASASIADSIDKDRTTVTIADLLSSIFVANPDPVYERIKDWCICALASNGVLYASASGYSTAQDFAQAVSGQTLVYPLATPLEITLDPVTLSTLKGQNNVWSDAGDVTLEYSYYEETEGY